MHRLDVAPALTRTGRTGGLDGSGDRGSAELIALHFPGGVRFAIVHAEYWRAWRVLRPASRPTVLPRSQRRRDSRNAVALRRRETSLDATRPRNPVPAARATWCQSQGRAGLIVHKRLRSCSVPAATSSEQSGCAVAVHRSGPTCWIAWRRRSRVLRQIRGSGPSSLQGTASDVGSRSLRLLVALESRSTVGEDVVSQLASEAVELLLAVARVWARFGHAWRTGGARWSICCGADSAPRDAVLAGDHLQRMARTGREPAVRMRQAIARLSRNADHV